MEFQVQSAVSKRGGGGDVYCIGFGRETRGHRLLHWRMGIGNTGTEIISIDVYLKIDLEFLWCTYT